MLELRTRVLQHLYRIVQAGEAFGGRGHEAAYPERDTDRPWGAEAACERDLLLGEAPRLTFLAERVESQCGLRAPWAGSRVGGSPSGFELAHLIQVVERLLRSSLGKPNRCASLERECPDGAGGARRSELLQVERVLGLGQRAPLSERLGELAPLRDKYVAPAEERRRFHRCLAVRFGVRDPSAAEH